MPWNTKYGYVRVRQNEGPRLRNKSRRVCLGIPLTNVSQQHSLAAFIPGVPAIDTEWTVLPLFTVNSGGCISVSGILSPEVDRSSSCKASSHVVSSRREASNWHHNAIDSQALWRFNCAEAPGAKAPLVEIRAPRLRRATGPYVTRGLVLSIVLFLVHALPRVVSGTLPFTSHAPISALVLFAHDGPSNLCVLG